MEIIRRSVWLLGGLVVGLVQASVVDAQEVKFDVRGLAIDANEGIVAADVDADGKLDLIAGRSWYQNGDWQPRPLRLIDDWNGYVESNGDYVFDVNADGLPDVVAGSFLPREIYWYENPGPRGLRLGQLWTKRLFLDSGQSQNEGGLLEDLDGDGLPELIVNRWAKNTPMQVFRFVEKSGSEAAQQSDSEKKKGSGSDEESDPAKYQLRAAKLGESGNGHGLAVGDLNGDGRKDVLVGQGWYEQPRPIHGDKPGSSTRLGISMRVCR